MAADESSAVRRAVDDRDSSLAVSANEARLAASEARFRAAVNAVQGILWTNDAAGRMVGSQPGWTALTGQSEAEYAGYGWSSAVHPDDAAPTVVAWEAAVAARTTFVFEHRVRRHDGAWRVFAVRAVPVLEADGSIREWVGVHTDITDQRAAEAALTARTAELSAANDEIQRTAAIVSHDLRAPLVNVLGFASELGRALAAVARQQAALPASLVDPDAAEAVAHDIPEALGFIRAAAERMDRLVSGILRVSRDGQRSLSPERIDVAGLVAGLRAGLAHQLEAAGATFDVEQQATELVADRLALEQVLANLLDNAVKYLDPARRGAIRLRIGRQPGAAVIAVADNGRGIAPSDHARVFDLFRRAGAQDRPGEGIGLAHVLVLVRRMGGRIDLDSAVGSGSTFTVTLPHG